MKIKVINCYKGSLEDQTELWLADLPSEPVVHNSNLAMDDRGWVCFTIFYTLD